MRTTRLTGLTAAAIVIGGGIALQAVSASAQTANDAKGSVVAGAKRPPRRENSTYFMADDVAGVRLFYREAGILPAAAEFMKQVVPTADLRYFDGGHFVLDENAEAVAEAIIDTFSR